MKDADFDMFNKGVLELSPFLGWDEIEIFYKSDRFTSERQYVHNTSEFRRALVFMCDSCKPDILFYGKRATHDKKSFFEMTRIGPFLIDQVDHVSEVARILVAFQESGEL